MQPENVLTSLSLVCVFFLMSNNLSSKFIHIYISTNEPPNLNIYYIGGNLTNRRLKTIVFGGEGMNLWADSIHHGLSLACSKERLSVI